MDKAGYGLIETMRVRDGRIPFLERIWLVWGARSASSGFPSRRRTSSPW